MQSDDKGDETKGTLLKDKVAVFYGAGGAIGGAVASAFAREGAKVFLTGRDLAPVEAVAKEINSAGGSAQATERDDRNNRQLDHGKPGRLALWKPLAPISPAIYL